MQTIIMTVGTSLITNPDRNLPENKRRPWVGKGNVGDRPTALNWMSQTDIELISAETNTFWRLNPNSRDEIILLHSETPAGLECAEVLQMFFQQKLDQKNIKLHSLPGINYDFLDSESALEKMAKLLKQLIESAQGEVILAATGGFKAQTMIMGLIGNNLGVPVCYIHEEFKGLVFLPYITGTGQTENRIRQANLPASGMDRSQVMSVRSDNQEPNRPRIWKKVKEILPNIPWVEKVYYDERAYGAPENGVKGSPQTTNDGRHIIWMRLVEKDKIMAVAIETTGRTPEQLQQALNELSERLGRLF